MFDSLEVKVLFTTWWRWSDREAQGCRREDRSGEVSPRLSRCPRKAPECS